MLESLNYNHLYYFWVVFREKTVTRAARKLGVTPQTVSAQIKALEASLKRDLFALKKQKLIPTEFGHEVYRFADEMFRVSQDLRKAIRGERAPRAPRIVIGVVETVSNLITTKLLQPVLEPLESVHYIFYADSLQPLLADLAEHRLDLVLSDAPIPPGSKIKAYNHKLGSSNIVILAPRMLARKCEKGFPKSLDGAQFLLPTFDAALRRSLDRWFDLQSVKPVIMGEFEDRALLEAFGQAGTSFFAAPEAIEDDLRRRFGLRRVGVAKGIQETYFAISMEKRVKNPLVVRIRTAARDGLFQKRLNR